MVKIFWTRLRVVAFISLVTVLAALISSCRESGDLGGDLASGGTVKVAVRYGGICQVGLVDLGWEQGDFDRIQVYHQETPVPVWITGAGRDAELHFYCQPSQSPYTSENIYQVRTGSEGGVRMLEKDLAAVQGSSPVETVTSTVHFEENVHYSPTVSEGEHWFWEKLTAPQRHSLEIDLVDVAGGDGVLKVALWGSTRAEVLPNHHAIVRVNGRDVGGGTWDGQTRHTIAVQVPVGVLVEGANTVEIELPGVTGVLVDIAYLDWIEISYSRLPRLEEGSLTFQTEGGPVMLSNVREGAYVFDVTDPVSVSVYTLSDHLPFQSMPDHRYLAVDSTGFLEPADLQPIVIYPDLRATQNAAAYLVIGPDDLLEAAAPLLELRASQGLSTLAVPVAAIYDQFNGSMAEPVAIQRFLAYAVENWVTPPEYVLLVGDASYDFKGYVPSGAANRLPVMMVSTTYGGETGSDVVLADINEDPWPDLAIGRIPATTPEQVALYLQKVLAYEGGTSGGDWRNRVLAVADGQEARFKRDATAFLALFPPAFQTILIAPQAEDGAANQDIVGEIERGNWLTAYFGHGSLTMWGADRLFTLDDSSALSNGDRLPIMIHLTCLTGLFTHPTQESLVESLLWQPDGGAVALLAPTSLTLPLAQVGLANAFTGALLESPGARLGDAVLHAWRQVPTDSADSRDVMVTFLLFGDPALIPYPQAP